MPEPTLERLACQRLVDKARQAGVADQIPQVLHDFLDGHYGSPGGRAWTRANPDDDQFRGCCDAEMMRGPAACTCWTPVYDLDQQPLQPIGEDGVPARDTLCGDCAYRPGSPERRDPLQAEALMDLPATGGVFFCHDGMRRPKLWRHPDGREVPGDPADYDPPFDQLRRPYRADGHVGAICAGWVACSRRIQNEHDKAGRAAEQC